MLSSGTAPSPFPSMLHPWHIMPPKIKLNPDDSFPAENGLGVKHQLMASVCSLSQAEAQHGSSPPFPFELQHALHFPLAVTALLEDNDIPPKKQRMANESKSHAEIMLMSPPGANAFLRNHVGNAPGPGLHGAGYASVRETARAHSQPCRKSSPAKLVTY